MRQDDITDEQLMQRYAGGDAAAFDALYARHEASLYRFVRRTLGSALAAQADEVFQDTWLRLVAARDRYAPQGATWRTWLFTIAHNLAVDRLRRSGRETVPEDAADEGEDPLAWLQSRQGMTHPASEDLAFWRAAGRQLLDCLDQLPGAQRAAFLLHHEDGETVEDMARRLALPFETAKSRLRYALSKLRTCMGSYLDALAPAPLWPLHDRSSRPPPAPCAGRGP